VAIAADLPWAILLAVCSCAPADCKALLRDGRAPDGGPSLRGLLGKALEHAAGLLQQTAVDEIHVSGP
jgi:hypothetical protein